MPAPSARAAWTNSNSRARSDLAAHEARVADPADQREREHDVDEARSEDRHERDREQQARETPAAMSMTRLIDIVDDARRSSRRSRRGACRRPPRRRRRPAPTKKRDAGAAENAREDVASELVEAERMRRASGPQAASASSCDAGSNGTSHGPSDRAPSTTDATTIAAAPALDASSTHSYRMRGSSRPYTRSVRRFSATYVTAMSRMHPCTSG